MREAILWTIRIIEMKTTPAILIVIYEMEEMKILHGEQMTTPATVTIRQEAVISIMKHRNKRKNGFMVVALSKKW